MNKVLLHTANKNSLLMFMALYTKWYYFTNEGDSHLHVSSDANGQFCKVVNK